MSEDVKVPEGWKRVRLGEVCSIIMGQSPSSALINREEKGIPFLQGNAEFTPKYPNPINWIEKPLKIAKKESILLSVRAPVGALNIADREYCIGRGLCSIVTNKNITHNLFIWYYLQFSINNLINLSQGSTFEAISSRELKNYSVPLPPLPEQQKIAEILETVDNAIEKTEKIIEKYKRIKQGLMQELLTKGIDENGRIRSEKTHKFKDSPIGRIPEEWEVVRLGEVSEIKGGKRLPKGEELIDEGHPYIRLVDIEGIRVNASKVKYIPEKIKQLISRYIVSKNDVILSIAGTIGLVALIPNELDGANLTENAVKITNLKNLDKNFLAFTLSNYLVQRQINMLTGVVAQPKLALFRLATILIPLPSLPEQQRIAEILSQIDNVIEKEEAYKQKLEQIKKGLMEDLLTGRVRVNHLIKEEENEK